MHLIVADTHFGKDDRRGEREKERDLIRCLRSQEREVTALYLLGDIFECFIEYRHLVPRGFVRFQSLIAEWAENGVDVTVFAGNHDPWHIDYFESDLGARVILDSYVTPVDGRKTYFHHGDGFARKSRFYNSIRSTLRHPLPVWMYRNLLPGDAGMRLAHLVSRKFGEEEVDEEVASDLRARARHLIDEGFDQVVFGHTHIPEMTQWKRGRYLNPGSWHDTRTLLRLCDSQAELLSWNGTVCEAYHGEAMPTAQ